MADNSPPAPRQGCCWFFFPNLYLTLSYFRGDRNCRQWIFTSNTSSLEVCRKLGWVNLSCSFRKINKNKNRTNSSALNKGPLGAGPPLLLLDPSQVWVLLLLLLIWTQPFRRRFLISYRQSILSPFLLRMSLGCTGDRLFGCRCFVNR